MTALNSDAMLGVLAVLDKKLKDALNTINQSSKHTHHPTGRQD